MIAIAQKFRNATVPITAVLWLGITGWLGYECLHYRRIAADQAATTARIERMNADLQDALARLRDESQGKLQRLSADNRVLEERITELERRAAVQPAGSPRPSIRTVQNPRPSPASPRTPVADVGPSAPNLPATAAGMRETPNNFSAPTWVPDYFSNEGASLLGNANPPEPHRHGRERPS
jgi:cell division protein FtsB